MKIVLIRFISIILTFFFVQGLYASSVKIESMNAICMNNEQWQEVGKLWMVSFFNTYKSLPLSRIDSDIHGESEDALADWLKRLFAKDQVIALQNAYVFTLVYKDGQLLGYTLHHVLAQSSIIHIHHFVVDPNFQGQGIGKTLLSAVIRNHPEIESIVLTTRILNAPAREFYKHQGFYEITEHIDNVQFDPSYSVLLKKDIKDIK